MNDADLSLEDAARVLSDAGWGVQPPQQYLQDMDSGFLLLWEKVKPFTLISPERGWALAEAVRYVCRSGIPGDFAECGVWKGGACLLASLVLHEEEAGSKRRIWLYDTFTGMVAPGDEDRIASSGEALRGRHPAGWWSSSLNEVKQTLNLRNPGSSNYKFVKGPVEETLNLEIPEQLAVLRLDTDWYESTMKELEVLYPRLVPGGILIIDDYGHFTGARKAVDEYFRSLGEPVLLHRSDYTGRVLMKKNPSVPVV